MGVTKETTNRSGRIGISIPKIHLCTDAIQTLRCSTLTGLVNVEFASSSGPRDWLDVRLSRSVVSVSTAKQSSSAVPVHWKFLVGEAKKYVNAGVKNCRMYVCKGVGMNSFRTMQNCIGAQSEQYWTIGVISYVRETRPLRRCSRKSKLSGARYTEI
jgi:hypothetical protein